MDQRVGGRRLRAFERVERLQTAAHCTNSGFVLAAACA
jgi:hypothetical protein